MSEFTGKLSYELSPKQVVEMADDNGRLEGYVSIHLSDIIDTDYEGFLDLLERNLVSEGVLSDISYEFVGIDDEPNTLIFEVTADASEIIDSFMATQDEE